MDSRQGFQDAGRRLAENHFVPDIVSPTSSLIFILESPHVQELKYGAPVSGASGATMTKHLFGERYAKYPLGILVKKNADENRNRPRLNRIGLLNVSNIPLQAAAYQNLDVRHQYPDLIRAMEHVRTSNQTLLYREEPLNAMQDIFSESLRLKLTLLMDRTATLVPCGRFAQKFFRLAKVSSPQWTVIDGVPHPSYNSWDRPQYRDIIEKVKQTLEAGL